MDLYLKYEINICIFALFFSHISFTNDLIKNETIINKTIFLDKFLKKII